MTVEGWTGMRLKDARAAGLTIGWWSSECCELDLYEITTLDDELFDPSYEEEEDDESNTTWYWRTREAALVDLLRTQ